MAIVTGFVDAVVSTLNLPNDKVLMEYISYVFLIWALSVVISLQSTTAPYGRYSRSGWGFQIPAKFAWTVQETPSFVVPLLVLFDCPCPKSAVPINLFALGLFLMHYFQRTFIFSCLIRGGKPTPFIPFMLAFLFCTINGYLQSSYLMNYATIEFTPFSIPRIAFGTFLFLAGFTTNIHSDYILRNLRKPDETGYKIPRGGLFEYVSGANFLGEIMEWWGFFVISCSLPTFTFAVFTSLNIGPRAFQHHRFYKEKFDDYPKQRKALIPFIL